MRMAPSGAIRMVISEQDSPFEDADSAASRILCACSTNRLTLYISQRRTEISAFSQDPDLAVVINVMLDQAVEHEMVREVLADDEFLKARVGEFGDRFA